MGLGTAPMVYNLHSPIMVNSSPSSPRFPFGAAPNKTYAHPFEIRDQFVKCLAFLTCATYPMQWCSLEGNRRRRRDGEKDGEKVARAAGEGRN